MYSDSLRLVIPVTVIDAARAVTRALDPDVGGYESWTPMRQNPDDWQAPPTGYFVQTPCSPEFKQRAMWLLQNPAHLHSAIAADGAQRWPGADMPTLADVQAFCAAAQMEPAQ